RPWAILVAGAWLAGCTEDPARVSPGTAAASGSAAATGTFAGEGAPAPLPAAASSGPASSDQTPAPGSTERSAGQQHYSTHCAGCHGPEAQGAFGPALAGKPGGSLADFRLAVREGQAAQGELLSSMPRFTAELLPEAALEEIHLYLTSLE
ncbi:MAG: c-type cytochrome, partial [Deinococcus sp.]|nr:c-type cytochrome [Deinococcus sp.]